jgi:hypothetical protein
MNVLNSAGLELMATGRLSGYLDGSTFASRWRLWHDRFRRWTGVPRYVFQYRRTI